MNKHFTPKQIEEIKRQAMAFWDMSTQQMAPFFDKINDYERYYRSQLPQELEDEYRKHPTRSAMVPPDIHDNIWSVRAHIHKLLYSKRPYARLSLPGQPFKRPEFIEKGEVVLSSLIDISGFPEESDKTDHQIFVCGVSGGITEWHREFRRVPVRGDDGRPMHDKAGQFIYDYEEVAAYPRYKPIDIRRIRLDDKAENVKDIRIWGYHSIVNESDLFEWNEKMPFISFKKKDLQGTSFPKGLYYEYAKEEDITGEKADGTTYGDKPVEVIEIRGQFRIGNGYKDLIVKIANRSLVIEARPNNLPVAGWETLDLGTIDVEYNKIFQMGLIEPIEDTFLEMFLKFNQSLDASNRLVHDQYLADMSAISDLPNQIEYVPGGVIPVNLAATGATSVNSVFMPIPKQISTIDTFQQAERCRQSLQEGMHRSSYTKGTDPTRKETATAVNDLVVAGTRNMEYLIHLLCTSYKFKVWKKYLIYQNFFAGHKQQNITTENGQDIIVTGKDLNHPFKMSVDIGAALDRPNVQRRLVEFFPFLAQSPTVDQYYFIKTTMEMLDLPNQDKILKSPEHLMAIIERENIALKHGIFVPVHPMDDHEMHVKIHIERGMSDADSPDFQMSDEAISAYKTHVETHQQFIEQANNPAGINKSKDGANTGQLVGGSNPKGATPE